MMSILKKMTLTAAAAGMLMLGPISVGDNTAKADHGWRGGRGWYGDGYYRRGIPGDGWRGGRYWSGYRGYRPYGGYYRPYYRPFYSPYYSYQPWYNVYQVPGYSPYYGFGVQVW